MCQCIVGWVDDPEVEGVHKSMPKRCSEYTTALEAELLRRGADSSDLDRMKRAFGISEDGVPPLFDSMFKRPDSADLWNNPATDPMADIEAVREKLKDTDRRDID